MWRVRRDRQKPYHKDLVGTDMKEIQAGNTQHGLQWFSDHCDLCMGFLAFFLPMWIMFVAFYASAVYPFGNDTFMRGDMFLQYVPFFSELMRQLKAGQGIAYTWHVGLGSNLLALYGYYLASPFYWLGLLVPEAYYVEFVSWLVPLKIGFCGLSAYIFFYTRTERMALAESHVGERYFAPSFALFFALGYALSGYMAAYNWNVMWLESIALLPLIIMGLERLVMQNKPYLYCLALSASILLNFYLSISICMFIVFYFGILWARRRKVSVVRDFVLYSALAGGIASVILVPEICALMSSELGGGGMGERSGSYFSLLEELARHCMLVRSELSGGKDTNYWPNIYCGVSAFLGIPLYAINKRISIRRRLAMLGLAGFFLLSFATPALDYIWHSMNYPHGLAARESFIYILLVLMIGHAGVMKLDFSDKRQGRRVVYLYLAVAALLLFFEKCMVREDVSAAAIWISLVFVTFYAVLLYLAYTREKQDMRRLLLFLAVLVMTLEVHIHTQATSVICNNREDYYQDVEEYRMLYQRIKEQDPSFYRLEVLGNRYTTDGVRVGFPSASALSSTVNAAVTNLYIRLGMHGGTHYYTYEGGNTEFTTALLNIKYFLCNNERRADERDLRLYEQGEDTLYQYAFYLPFGYVVPAGWDLAVQEEPDGIAAQNMLYADLGLSGQLFEGCGETEVATEISYTATEDGIYYGVLLQDSVYRVFVSGGENSENWPYMGKGAILKLGMLKTGQTVSVKGESQTGEQQSISMRIYRLQEDALERAIIKLSGQHLEQVRFDSTHITGTLQLDEAGRLLLSVPYEKGWTARLNGESVKPALFGDALMAFDLAPGIYTLELSYVPDGKYAGIMVSLASMCLLVGLWKAARKRNVRCDTNIPEKPLGENV